MQYALTERIGDPTLFCGREKEMKQLMDWASGIPRLISKSKAILGRRKSGKTAIMQRLFNLLWQQNGAVIPFYFEVTDKNIWMLKFAESYFCTFLSHFFSFVHRKLLPENIAYWDWDQLFTFAKEYGNKEILRQMNVFKSYIMDKEEEHAITLAFNAPAGFSGYSGKYFVVMIDEIQYMTEYVFQDKELKIKAYNLPGAFHGLVELKHAPMLVAGSYIGWMTQMMQKMFVGCRLRHFPLSPKLDEKGGIEAVYKYAEHYDVSVTDDIAMAINNLVQSDPFYMTTLFGSPFRDFSSVEGVTQTFLKETAQDHGELFHTWMEYINISIKQVNDRYAKQILLILSKNRNKAMGRNEILNELGWSQDRDAELEEKLIPLVYGGLIQPTVSSYHYRGIPDDVLDFIFRQRYYYEIYNKPFDLQAEIKNKVKELEEKNRSLSSKVNELKGRLLEIIVWREMNQYRKQGKPLAGFEKKLRPMPAHVKKHNRLTMTHSLTIGMIYLNYYLQTPNTFALELDLLIEGISDNGYRCLVFEFKHRDEKQLPTKKEMQDFVQKIELFTNALKQQGYQDICICPIYFSAKGFRKGSEKWLHEHHIFSADLKSWGIN